MNILARFFFYPNRTICRLVLWYGHVCFPVFVTFRRNPSIAKSENDRAIPFERTNFFFFFFLPNITRAGANFTDMKMRQKRTRRLQVLLYYFFSFFFFQLHRNVIYLSLYIRYTKGRPLYMCSGRRLP